MKPIATQYVECVELLKANGVTPEQIAEAVKATVSEEHKLSVVLSLKKKHNIKESVEIRESRIDRKNGSNREIITESKRDDLAVEVARLARSYGMSKAEAILMLESGRRLEVYGLSDKQLTESWKPYAGVLSESEIATLVRGRVAPPVKK
jgi:hypothetical protein